MEAMEFGRCEPPQSGKYLGAGKQGSLNYSVQTKGSALVITRVHRVSQEITVEATFVAHTSAALDRILQSDSIHVKACAKTAESLHASARDQLAAIADA
jgi:hypothetical protein